MTQVRCNAAIHDGVFATRNNPRPNKLAVDDKLTFCYRQQRLNINALRLTLKREY